MKIQSILTVVILLFYSSFCYSQTANKKVAGTSSPAINQAAKYSPAYAEVLLLKTEIESQLEEFSADFTDDFPKLKEARFQLDLIQKEIGKILAVSSGEASKLSVALGKLIVGKIALETNLWNLKNQYKDDYPEVQRAKRKVEVYEKAIREILP